MKKYLLKLIAVIACLHGLAWTSASQKQPNLTDLVAVYSVEHAQKLPQAISSAPIKDLIVTKKVIQFSLRNVPIKIEWIGEKARLFKFNGHLFSERNIRNNNEFIRAVYAKFGIYRPRTPSSDATTTEEVDQPRIRFESNPNSGYQEWGTGQVNDEAEPETDEFSEDDEEEGILSDHETMQRFRVATQAMSGADMREVVTGTATVLSSFQSALNTAMGRPAGTDMFSPWGAGPSCIPSPYWKNPCT